MRKPHVIERPFRPSSTLRSAKARIDKRQFDVFQRACAWQQRRQLENKAYFSTSDRRALILAQVRNFSTSECVSSGIGALQNAEQIH